MLSMLGALRRLRLMAIDQPALGRWSLKLDTAQCDDYMRRLHADPGYWCCRPSASGPGYAKVRVRGTPSNVGCSWRHTAFPFK